MEAVDVEDEEDVVGADSSHAEDMEGGGTADEAHSAAEEAN